MKERYANHHNIWIDGESEYVVATYACLTELSRLQSGKTLLKELDEAGREVTIRKPDRVNKCEPLDKNAAATKFARAIMEKQKGEFLAELKKAVEHGLTRKGMNAGFVKDQLFKGLSPIDRMSVFSNVSPGVHAEKTAKNLRNWNQQDDQGAFRNAYTLLKRIIEDPKGFDVVKALSSTSGSRAVTDLMSHQALLSDLQRLFRASFEDAKVSRGPGSACIVHFQPAKPAEISPRSTSVPPVDSVDRPPVIGLAHELVHTLRAVQGLLTTCDKIEEGLAVGLPPFNFEKYSENLFRAQYNKQLGGTLPARAFYESYVKVSDKGYASALKAYVEYLRKTDPQAATEFARKCKES
ncbi:hypothetical protein EG835_09200, partial [bacterium]|nr:hypothetical protein [bacterium]